jgi:hypothetical protein
MSRGQDPYTIKVLGNLMQELQKSKTLLWSLFKHPRVPLVVKAIPVIAFLYWLNPVDPLPFPFNLAPIDDIVAVLLGLKLFVELCPQDLVEALRYEIAYGNPVSDDEVIDTTYQILDDEL